ncbi:MAG TPA: glycosyltransferase family 4 protein [Candidatus Acidoferrales bacterium]|nr:glycosyltransferase family 4 protein [Candidatus Acidoferrales bacterium]
MNFVSSFPPRQCGIATFTRDLADNISKVSNNVFWNVSAIEQCKKNLLTTTRYPASKIFQTIKDCEISTYLQAANKINSSKIDVVNIQHEFGLYKGDHGEYIVNFLSRLQKPVVTTFHTVLPDPPHAMKNIVKTISDLSDRIVVSANVGVDILKNTFHLPLTKLIVIPHGVPDVPFIDTERPKKYIGLPAKFIIGSYGLINPDKGIEYVLEAMPQIIDDNPDKDIIYLIVGAFHPSLEKSVRTGYRQLLRDIVKELGLTRHVKFIEKYLTNKDMILHFLATDICAVTNMNYKQISSGVLSQAIGCGKPIIATKFMHAKESLADGKGLLVDFGNVNDLSEKLNFLVQHDSLRKKMALNTYCYGRTITWSEVAKMYINVFNKIKAPKITTPLITPLKSYETLVKTIDKIHPIDEKKTKI